MNEKYICTKCNSKQEYSTDKPTIEIFCLKCTSYQLYKKEDNILDFNKFKLRKENKKLMEHVNKTLEESNIYFKKDDEDKS
jgi:hypothetical protein